MEKKRSKGITILGVTAIVLNSLYLAPFALLLGIPAEGDKLLKIPLAGIPFVLSLLGIFCGVNLIRRVKLQLTLVIVNVTIIYYFLIILSIPVQLAEFPLCIYSCVNSFFRTHKCNQKCISDFLNYSSIVYYNFFS